jgi:hypothetical protein
MLALAAIAAAGFALVGCGRTSGDAATNAHSSSQTAPVVSTPSPPLSTTSSTGTTANYTKVDSDKDNDFGNPDIDRPLEYGQPAGEPDRKAIADVVRRYYAAALAGNGVKACSLLYSTLVEGAPEDYAVPGGPSYLQGARTCAAVERLLFRHFHAQLAAEVPKLRVRGVLLKERRAMALLSFAGLPERDIPVTREGHVWRISALLDDELL